MLKKISKLKLLKRNIRWLSSDIQLSHKLSYYLSLISTFLRMAITKEKSVVYLGAKFYYDNFATPFTLQLFPHEINEKILKNCKKPIRKILDIGGNIGQFSYSLKKLSNVKKIDIFEPNTDVLPILERNIKNLSGVKAYNYGLGKEGVSTLYFEPGSSGVGSMIKDNAGKKKTLKEVKVKLISSPSSMTKTDTYDLIKIDVEGFEAEVIKSITGVKTKYMFIEMSSDQRESSSGHSSLLEEISKKFGEFNIIHSYTPVSDEVSIELLLEFV